MRRRNTLLAAGLAIGAALAVTAVGSTASADGRASDHIREVLSGYQEDPLVVSTTGRGEFRARIDNQTITYRLSYSNLTGNILQAHIHLGGKAQSGGIIVFLCTNLGNGPAGTQLCPPAPATITGTIQPADVINVPGQGIAPGEFAELVAAIRADVTYVNVHTETFTAGEIRGQIDHDHH